MEEAVRASLTPGYDADQVRKAPQVGTSAPATAAPSAQRRGDAAAGDERLEADRVARREVRRRPLRQRGTMIGGRRDEPLTGLARTPEVPGAPAPPLPGLGHTSESAHAWCRPA